MPADLEIETPVLDVELLPTVDERAARELAATTVWQPWQLALCPAIERTHYIKGVWRYSYPEQGVRGGVQLLLLDATMRLHPFAR